MANFVDSCIFTAASAGTGDFVVGTSVTGYMLPGPAGVTNGLVYRYRAENDNLSEWEIGYGVYSSNTFARTTILYNSAGNKNRLNFAVPPRIGIVPLKMDFDSMGGRAFTGDDPPPNPVDGDFWWESNTGHLFIFYGDFAPGYWVMTNGAVASGTTSGSSRVPTSDTPPPNPVDGDMWWDSRVGGPFIYYVEVGAPAGQWVAFPTGGGGSTSGPATFIPLFDTRAQAVGTVIPGTTNAVRLAGYTTVGDGGAALYIKVGTQPTHAGKFQSADGAWWALAEIVICPEMLGAVGNGVINDGVALQNTFAMGRPIELTRMYASSNTITVGNTPVSVRGKGYKTGIVDIGIAAGAYLLSIVQTDYSTPVYIRDLSLLTKQVSLSRGLYCKFGAADAEFNRIPSRFVMENVDVRGATVDSGGWMTVDGFALGITLQNIIRATCTNVMVCGRGDGRTQAASTSMTKGFDLLSDYHPSDDHQRAAPTDPVFRDCHVYCADKGFSVDGHWEGLIFDHCVAVLVNYAYYVEANNPPGTGGIQYPWIEFKSCHANFLYEAIHVKEYFDVKIHRCILYKWTPAVVGWISWAINLSKCTLVEVDGVNIFNLDAFPSTPPATPTNLTQLNGIFAGDCDGVVIRAPQFTGVTYGVEFAGTTKNSTYERGLWGSLPAFAPTPIEYQDIGSGGNNRRKGVLLDVRYSSLGGASVVGVVDLIYAALDTVFPGDDITVEIFCLAAKDGTTSSFNLYLVKSVGSASIAFYNGRPYHAATFYAPGGLQMVASSMVKMRVTAAGTLTLALQAACGAGGATVNLGDAQLRVTRV